MTTSALSHMDSDQLSKAVRAACVQAAVRAYEDAGTQGLCAEGRLEAAVGAIEALDLRKLIRELEYKPGDGIGKLP